MKNRSFNPFGPVWGASGVQGFFGEGYPFHDPLHRLCPGFSFRGMSFVAKTTTQNPRLGNMPLDGITPRERLPQCVWVSHRRGIALNAVGLSNPGLEALLVEGMFPNVTPWQKRTDPFQISLMSLQGSVEERVRETTENLALLSRVSSDFWTEEFGIQLNISCPNVDISHSSIDDTIIEISKSLDTARDILPGIKIIIKLSPTFPPERAVEISEHPACWGICFSNTLPWRNKIPWLPKSSPLQVNWDSLFSKDERSPLQRRGFEQPGGLSGRPLLPITCAWIRQVRKLGVKCHINGGGGILSRRDVDAVFNAGADSISLGSIAFLRPWRLEACTLQAWKQTT